MLTNQNATASVDFCLEWQSSSALHKDYYFAETVNFWRDILPKPMNQAITGRFPGDSVQIHLNPGDYFPEYDRKKLFSIKRRQFDSASQMNKAVAPRIGRFYPKGFLKDIPNVFRINIEPFRCTDIQDDSIQADFNHPLSDKKLSLTARISEVSPKRTERGGGSTDWLEVVCSGPGMQVRRHDIPTDFFSDDPFQRDDETPDSKFYEQPRLVQHIDSKAIDHVRNLYGSLLPASGRILDLMSSWTSHLPDNPVFREVVGLGMNEEELSKNNRLDTYTVHDLNQHPVLPFDDAGFDAVICTVSAEYLIRPSDIFSEVARVLKPGCPFIVTFSNRWFPPKAIRIWKEIHEFERMGLVTEYFLRSGAFNGLTTVSMRGYPRPEDDKYYSQFLYSDPIYTVFGSKSGADSF